MNKKAIFAFSAVLFASLSGCAAQTSEDGDVPEVEDLPVAGQSIPAGGCTFTAKTPEKNAANTQVRGVITYSCQPGQPSISYRVDVGDGTNIFASNYPYYTLAYSSIPYSGTRYTPWYTMSSGVQYRSRAAANHTVTEWSTGYVTK
jgi:hypothetical protein